VSIGVWGLREEARKFWDYFVSDKIVYLSETNQGQLKCSHAEQYLKGDLWIEIHWTLPCVPHGEMHFKSITEVFLVGFPSPHREPNIKGVGTNGNRAVLVECPQFVQLPEGIIPVGIPSKMWLNRVESICHCGWKQTTPIPVGGVIVFENKETDVSLFPLTEDSAGSENMGHLPSQLIQRSAQTANPIAQGFRDGIRGEADFYPPNLQNFFKIIFMPNGEGWKFNPLIDLPLKRVEMFLRPAGFHIYMDERNFASGIHPKRIAEQSLA
jgi:hypothetical protein